MGNGDSPATKADLQQLESRIRSEMQQLNDTLIEAFRDMKTELLKGFAHFAQPIGDRIKLTENETSSLRSRMAAVEERLTEIEMKINFPPRPQ